MEEQASDLLEKRLYTKAKASRFRFKSSFKRHSTGHKSEYRDEDTDDYTSKRHKPDWDSEKRCSHRDSRCRHKHKHRTSYQDHHPTSIRDGAYYDPDYRHRESLYDTLEYSSAGSSGPAPDEAFRESLFDALADDEGAAYWEGVYGQPVHIYPDTKPGPGGKLERMTEEEYADYVRTKMWEKSHQHIVEEREAKERARPKRKAQHNQLEEESEREEAERESIRRRMEESLRRGEERKKAKEAEATWESYTAKWDSLKKAQRLDEETVANVREMIPWPVASGKARHVSKEEIERFFWNSKPWREDSVSLLKMERVRWHPDKLQQRFGQHIHSETMKLVTSVFQVIDRLWNDLR